MKAVVISAIAINIFLQARLHQHKHSHHQGIPFLTTNAVDQDGRLEGQYCALADVFDAAQGEVTLKTYGISIGFYSHNSPTGTNKLCIINSVKDNYSTWAYANVDASDGDLIFSSGSNYKDYGKSTPVKTDYQDLLDLPAGYVGPINAYGFANWVATKAGKAELLDYIMTVYYLPSAIHIGGFSDLQKTCSKTSLGKASLKYESSFSYTTCTFILLSIISLMV